MPPKTDLTGLLTLIKLLKAEGVKEYSENGLHLIFSGEVSPHRRGSDEESGREASETKAEADSHSPAPPELSKLNPNYAKLVGWSKR